MKIEIKNNNFCNFVTLTYGQVFSFADSYYMKINNHLSERYNAISLTDGILWHFDTDDKVEITKCKLVND